MDSVLYLTADQILRHHREVLEEFGGNSDGVLSEQGLLSAIMQPQQSAFGEDAYPTVAEKAAAYGSFLNQAHPFVEGNKRTAAIAMLVFLDINGCDFDQSDDRIIKMFLGVATGSVDQDEFFRWVCTYAHRADEGRVLPFNQR